MRTTALRLAAAAAITAATVLSGAAPAYAQTQVVPIADRSYTLKVTTVRAFDETGPVNSLLSDEIYGRFGTNPSNAAETRLFGDFDAGETRVVPANQNCLSPKIVQVNNAPSTLSGRQNDSWSCATIGLQAPIIVSGSLFERDTGGDESLGLQRVTFTQAGLATDFPTVGPVRNYDSDFRGAGGHYRVTYQVQRIK